MVEVGGKRVEVEMREGAHGGNRVEKNKCPLPQLLCVHEYIVSTSSNISLPPSLPPASCSTLPSSSSAA